MKTVLSIAGTAPTGGAGIQTDLKTFEAFGVYGMAVITVVCAQNTTGVFGMQPVSAELVGKQIDCVFDDIFPDAVKVGMLYDAEIIHTVAERLKAYHAKNIVLDPVMMSSSGTALLHHDATVVVIEHDLDVIKNADYVIDMGPGGGEAGGQIIASGTPQEIKENPNSITGNYI